MRFPPLPLPALAPALALMLLATALGPPTCLAAEGARSAAEAFGQALTASQARELRTVLPAQGKVQLVLRRMGPADGFFDGRQVEAIFADFLEHGSVGTFEVSRVESDRGNYALVRADVALIDRDGHQARVSLQLALEAESGHWVVRGIKESSR